MGGCNPCKTKSHRYNIPQNQWDVPLRRQLQEVLSTKRARWLINLEDKQFALEIVIEDYQYYKDDSLVYDGLFFKQLTNPEADVRVFSICCFRRRRLRLTGSSWWLRIRFCYSHWHGTGPYTTPCSTGKREVRKWTWRRRKRWRRTWSTIRSVSPSRQNDIFRANLVLGYIVSAVNGEPYPEAVGILLPTFCGSFVADRCPRAILDVDDEDFKACRYNFCVSLYRLHIDTAIPFPLGAKTVFFYQNCLILRPSKRMPHRLFRGQNGTELIFK